MILKLFRQSCFILLKPQLGQQEKLCDAQKEDGQRLQDIDRKYAFVRLLIEPLIISSISERFSLTWSCKLASSPSASTQPLFALHSSLHPPEAHLASPSCGISLPASPSLRFAPLSPNCQFVFYSIRTARSVRPCAGGFGFAPAGAVPDQSLGNVGATSRLQQSCVNLTL